MLLAFFSSWIKEHQRKLDEWRGSLKREGCCERIQPMIAERMAVLRVCNEFVRQGIAQFEANEDEFLKIWLKLIYKRF